MLTLLFAISILNVFTMITNSKIMKNSQDFILITRILIDFSFLIMISIMKTIITINNNNNNNNHKLFKNNNVYYSRLIDFYKSSAKTQISLLNKINLVSKT